MSVCVIYIKFDREDRTYLAGETVSGEVVVKSRRDISCNKLMLYVGWRPKIKGKSTKIELSYLTQTIINQEITWKKGANYSYPFKFTAPSHLPTTFHGRNRSIDWYVRASAMVRTLGQNIFSVSHYPKYELTFNLTTDRSLRFNHRPIDLRDPFRYSMYEELLPMLDKFQSFLDRPQRNLWLLFGLVLLIGIVAFVYLNAAPAERELIILFFTLTFIVAVIAAIILLSDLQNWRATRQLGYIEMDFKALERNEGIAGIIRFSPNFAVQIQQIEMKLKILESREEVRSRLDGNETVVHKNRIFYESVSDTRLRNIHANEPFEAILSLKSDYPLPPSYTSESYNIEWLVTIKLVLSGRKIWRKIPIQATYESFNSIY